MTKKDRKQYQQKRCKTVLFGIGTALTLALSACGDGSTEDTTLVPVNSQPILTDEEQEIVDLETKYQTGEFTQEDYLALADAYSRGGRIRAQRDLLEQEYRLYGDTDALETLRGLSVNLAEETTEIRDEAGLMIQNLELPEYLDESINLIDSADWFQTMMPKLREGQRNYYMEKEGEPFFYLQIGYDADGDAFSRVWYTTTEQKYYLSQTGSTIHLISVTPPETPLAATVPADTAWSGVLEAWTLDSATGNITHEKGQLTNGVFTGAYTCEIHTGEGSTDIYSLWSNREGMEYVTYTGSFDAEGKSLAEQPAEAAKNKLLEGTGYADLVIYAYDSAGENCLWQGIGESENAAGYAFGGELSGLIRRPEYTSYDIAETVSGDDAGNTTAGASAPKIRIYDGEIQWFDGTYWVSAGSVRTMEKEDPFAAYEETHGGSSDNAGQGNLTQSGQGTSSISGDTAGDSQSSDNKNSGSIQKESPTATPKPSATTKPSNTTKPAATPKPAASTPAATPNPAATPTPAPVVDDDDDDDDGGSSDSGSSDSGSSDSGSSDSGSSDSGSSDSGSSDSGSSGGSDVDMDWTPDLL